MPQITKSMLLAMLVSAAVLVSVTGCGTPNSTSTFDSEAGHAAGWLPAKHRDAYEQDRTSCAECHGEAYEGGISKISCFSCHLGGPGSVHPQEWSGMTATIHASYVTVSGNSSCSNVYCHGADLRGVADSGPSCSSCHLGGADSVHPSDWGAVAYYKHSVYTKSSGTSGCATAFCHGTDLGGAAGSGPSCTKCHLGGVSSVHPAAWSADIVLHRDYVASKGSSACANAVCHGPSLTGVTLSGPSCYSCH